MKKTRAVFAPKRTTKGTASGNLQLRHGLFPIGAYAPGRRASGGRDCGAGKIRLTHDSTLAAAASSGKLVLLTHSSAAQRVQDTKTVRGWSSK
jgi:hypothetical protein